MRKVTLLNLVFAALMLSGCGDDGPTDTPLQPDAGDTDVSAEDAPGIDAAADAGVDPLERTPPADGVAPDGHPEVDAALSPGQVRAGRILGEDTGFHGVWAHCRQGDFKLYNARVAVCIQSETTNRFEVFNGGMLVDAKRVDRDDEDVLDFVMPMVGLGTTTAESVEVIRDGSEGGPAVVRVQSRDVAIAHLIGVLGNPLADPQDVSVTTEYRLDPDSDNVEIVSWYHNANDGRRSFIVGDWFAYGDRGKLWTNDQGLGFPSGGYKWLASLSEDISFGWITTEDDVREMGLNGQGLPWAASRARQVRLETDEEDVFRRWLVVGDGTLATIQQAAAELRGEPLDTTMRTLEVRTDDGQPVVDREVIVDQGDQALGWGRTDADGQVHMLLPAQQSLDVFVEGWSGGDGFERQVTVGDEPTAVTIDTPATLALSVSEAGGVQDLTAQVVVQGGRGERAVALHGELELQLAAGDYQVHVMRGPEYDAARVDISVQPGEHLDESVTLERAFSTDGWLSGDFHQHMEPSLDSEERVDDRLLENAAMGVDIAVSTDHDAVTDLRPLLAKYGLEHVLTTFPGVEISPLETHVGLMPMDYEADERGRGTIPLAVMGDDGEAERRLIPELVELARQLPSDPVVQLNHGRRSTSGLLELVDFEPEVGPGAVDDFRFTTDFDTIEIINRFSAICQLFGDWSGFLNAGYRFTGLGNSDTHGLSGESGLPRNYLHIGKSVDQVQAADVRQALRAGQVSVGAHTFLELSDGRLPGDLISTTDTDNVAIGVRVHTPAWARADKLIAVVNGEVVQTFDRSAQAGDHLDFDETLSMSFAQDSWVVFFAWGPQPTGPMGSGKAVVGFTNPVYIDVDGDADSDGHMWEPPGVKPLSLGAVNEFCN